MMLTVKEKVGNLTEAAYAALRGDLLACRLPPGDKLNIASLSARLGVSLGAVREALARLTAEGLTTVETNRGFSVAPVSQAELLDLTSTRIEIEIACLKRAMVVGGVEWETRIVAAHYSLSRTPERADGDANRISDEWAEAHKEFHAALVAACDSPWRLRLRTFLYDQTERYRRLSAPASPSERDIGAEHRALMDAALARDEGRSAHLMASHLNITATRVLSLASINHEKDRPARRVLSLASVEQKTRSQARG